MTDEPWKEKSRDYFERLTLLVEAKEKENKTNWTLTEIMHETGMPKQQITKTLKSLVKFKVLKRNEDKSYDFLGIARQATGGPTSLGERFQRPVLIKMAKTEAELQEQVLKANPIIPGQKGRQLSLPRVWFILQVLTHDAEPVPGTDKQGVTSEAMGRALGLTHGVGRNTRVKAQIKGRLGLIKDGLNIERHGEHWILPKEIVQLIHNDANLSLEHHLNTKLSGGKFMPNAGNMSYRVGKALLDVERENRNQSHSLRQILNKAKRYEHKLTQEQLRPYLIRATGWLQYTGNDHWKVTPAGHEELKRRILTK